MSSVIMVITSCLGVLGMRAPRDEVVIYGRRRRAYTRDQEGVISKEFFAIKTERQDVGVYIASARLHLNNVCHWNGCSQPLVPPDQTHTVAPTWSSNDRA